MILKAHGDGSREGGVVAVVTLLAEASRWDDSEARWKDAAKRAGCYPFGLADFFAVEKDPETRTRILTELMTILSQPWCASLVCLTRVSASASNAGLGDFD